MLYRRTILLVLASVLALLGCKGKPDGAGAAKHRFAFVTNNSSDFLNIAEKGVRKAEKELGVDVQVFRPLKGEVADQQRFLEDILTQGFDGVAISPINADAMTSLLDGVAAKVPLICHDSDAPKSKRKAFMRQPHRTSCDASPRSTARPCC